MVSVTNSLPPTSIERVRAAFAGTRAPDDPLNITHLPASLAKVSEFVGNRLSAAAVLVPIINGPNGIEVLLTQRAQHLRTHAGQVSFPGGRVEAGDVSLAAAALRETHEEVGIEPSRIEVVGYLSPQVTATGFAMTSVIGLIEGAVDIRPDPSEVDSAFFVPLDFLLDKGNHHYAEREFHGARITVTEIMWGDYRIWGATAHVIRRILKRLNTNI